MSCGLIANGSHWLDSLDSVHPFEEVYTQLKILLSKFSVLFPTAIGQGNDGSRYRIDEVESISLSITNEILKTICYLYGIIFTFSVFVLVGGHL